MKKHIDFEKEIEKVLMSAKKEVGNSKSWTLFADAVFANLCPNGYRGTIGKMKKALRKSINEGHYHQLIKVAYDGGWFNRKMNGWED